MTNVQHGLSRFDKLMEHCAKGTMRMDPRKLPQTFGRLLPKVSNPLQWSGELQDLAEIFNHMIDPMRAVDNDDGPAEAGMTFIGQFIDHDVTLDATSTIGTQIDPSFIRNVRTPALDLDCVYGDGPEASPHLYVNVNQNPDLEEAEGFMLFGRKDNPLDLARNDQGTALIGDPRNDENIFVSQIQGAFVCLHNILMSYKQDDPHLDEEMDDFVDAGMGSSNWTDKVVPKLKDFNAVRQFIRWHYQWLIMKRFLPAFVTESAIIKAQHPDAFPSDAAIMPVEFAGAAYRFGHATAQIKYALKHGAEPIGFFTHHGFKRRPVEANLDMNMMFDIGGETAPRARPVGTKVASPLFELPFISGPIEFPGVTLENQLARRLPLRNVLRDRLALELASGQQVAQHLGLNPLPVPEVLAKHNIEKTPLWFYTLEEADASGQQKLDGVGGTIVAWVLLRLLRLDKTSVLHQPGFEPWHGFGGKDMTFGSLMAFVEKHRDKIKYADRLQAG
ncbi:peroxidase family protein [Thalassococcus lentus]|uniref:Animal haem peroxidase n=1 Tax=Thalassococcus lentus TaxID=1210524 RepID=A0ABT4XVM0_9RHOB|nr:peroxidase family protein [Thalassococcus lentus]MDA7426002.1 hypothetical protein [Thalassococcus lentus]